MAKWTGRGFASEGSTNTRRKSDRSPMARGRRPRKYGSRPFRRNPLDVPKAVTVSVKMRAVENVRAAENSKPATENCYLKYIQAATATKTTARIQRDESLIPVFLAMANLNLICPFPEMMRSTRKCLPNQTSRERESRMISGPTRSHTAALGKDVTYMVRIRARPKARRPRFRIDCPF